MNERIFKDNARSAATIMSRRNIIHQITNTSLHFRVQSHFMLQRNGENEVK